MALDLGFWIDHYVLFEQLEAEDISNQSDLVQNFDEQYFPTLIDKVEDNGKTLISLSATGILFHQRSRLQFQKQKNTPLSFVPQTDTPPDQKPIRIRDDHGKDVLLEFANKLVRSPYITKVVNSLPFNPKQANPIRQTSEEGMIEFVLTWTDPGFGLCLQTTGRNLRETNAIAIHLVNQFT